jgi:hypothetical protein
MDVWVALLLRLEVERQTGIALLAPDDMKSVYI